MKICGDCFRILKRKSIISQEKINATKIRNDFKASFFYD